MGDIVIDKKMQLKAGTTILHIKGDDVDYTHWTDASDRDHVSGMIGENRFGTLVSKHGYKIIVKDGDIEAVKVEK